MPQQFKAGGYDWTITLTVGAVKRVRDETGVNLCDAFVEQSKLVSLLMNDPIALVDVLAVLTATERENKPSKIEADEFRDMFAGDAIAGARRALLTELGSFLDDLQRRKTWRLVVDALHRVHVLEHDAAERDVAAMVSAAETRFSPAAGSLPESSDSPAPTITPSAS